MSSVRTSLKNFTILPRKEIDKKVSCLMLNIKAIGEPSSELDMAL